MLKPLLRSLVPAALLVTAPAIAQEPPKIGLVLRAD